MFGIMKIHYIMLGYIYYASIKLIIYVFAFTYNNIYKKVQKKLYVARNK